MRLYVRSKQRIHKPVVVVESGFVDVPRGAIREHPGPGYGETIMCHFELLKHSDILFHFVVTVAGYIPSVVIGHAKRGMSKLVPDAQTFSISSPPTFNLKM